MQNLLEIQDTLKTASAQQLMGLLQNPNPSVPQWAVVAQMNTNKEMLDEQTRQQGLGQPTVLEGLMQVNVAGMPQDDASNMGQNIAPKTDTDQNTGIASVAPVATMASGGVLKMQEGGDPAEKTYTFIYPEGMNRPSFELEISASGAYNSVVKAIRELGGTIIEKDTGRVMQSDTAKEILQESSDVAEADARVSEYIPSASDLYGTESGRFKSENAVPENYVVSAGLPPAGGAMYSSPTGGQGGNTDSSRLGLPTDEFSEVPLSSISTPEGLATLAAAGDADMRDEVVVGDTSTLSEKELRKQADNRNEAGRARFELMRALEATNSKGQPGGTLGKRYAESGDDLRMVDAQRYIESLIKGDPYSGELSPSQTERNQKTLSDTLRREEVARQRADIAEAGEIAQDAADTREAFSVPITIDATKPLMSSEALSNVKDAATLRTAALANTAKPKVTPDIAEFGKYADQYTEMRNEREVDSVVEAAERNEIARVKAKIAKREALNTSEKELADKITAFGKYADQYTTMRDNREVDMTVEAAERGEAARIAAKTGRQNPLKEIKQNASVDQRSGLERLEAENEANLPEDMKQQLRINSYARAGRTAAEIADLLGVSAGKVLDVAAGTLSAGLLETTALGADVMSAYQAGVMGNTDSGMFYANVANKIKQFSDDTFFEDNKLPRLSTALNIPTNAEADAAAAAEQTKAINAKIMAMPADSSVFAEGSPTEYTPAGLAAIQAKRDALNLDRGPADRENDTVGILEGLQSVTDARNKARFSGSPYSTEIKNERTGPIPEVEPLVKIDTSTEEPVVNTAPVDGAVVKTKQGLPLVYNDDINAWMLSNIPVDGEETAETEDAKAIEAGTEAAALATKYFESPGTYGDYEGDTSLGEGVVPAQDNSGKSVFRLNNARAEAKKLGPTALMEFDRAQTAAAPMINDGRSTIVANEDNPNNAFGVSKELAQYLPEMPQLLSDPVGLLASLDSNLANNKDLSEEEIQALTTQRDVLAGAIQTGEYIDGAVGDAAALIGRLAMKAGRAGNKIVEVISPDMGAKNLEIFGRNEEFLDGLAKEGAFTEAVPTGEVVDDGLDRTVYPQSDIAPRTSLRPKLRPTASGTSGTNTSGTSAGGTSVGGAGVSAALSAGASAGSKSGSAGGYQDRLASILDRMEARKDEDKWMSLADMGLRLMGSKNPNFLGAVGESGLGALQGYRQQQGANQKQEIGILGKLGDFDMAERTLQARMAIANASAAGRGGAKAKDVLAVLEARRAELTGPLAPTNLSPSEQVAKDTALADIDRQIGALTGVTINSTPQVVQADASDDVSFLGRINNYISS